MYKLPVHLIPPTILPKAKTIEKSPDTSGVIYFLRGCSYPEGTILPRFCAISVMATRLPIARRAALLARKGHAIGWVLALSLFYALIVFNGTICFWALHMELNYFVRVRAVA